MPTHCTNVLVNRRYSLVCARLHELACNQFFKRENDAIFAPYAYRCAAVFYCLDSVLGLGILSVWVERKPSRGELAWKFLPSGEKTELERS